MFRSFMAETDKLFRRPAFWILAIVWLTISQTFSYLIPYVSYLNGASSTVAEGTAEQLLAGTLPSNLIFNSLSGLPAFGGAIAVVLGALTVGSEYGWGTFKTILTQRSQRLSVYAGKLLALLVSVLAIVLATFTLGTVSSLVIASIESKAMAWPSLTAMAQGLASGFLIVAMWSLFGVMLSVLFRSTALPIGLGIVWALAVENLISGVAAPMLEFFRTLQKGLPGANAGSLVAALSGQIGDVPGVVAVVGGTHATLVLSAYVAGFILLSTFVFLKRDVV